MLPLERLLPRSLRMWFSESLGDLADHAVGGMWFSKIFFEDGGTRIQLKGLTTNTIGLTEFLQRLFEGRSFRRQHIVSRWHQ